MVKTGAQNAGLKYLKSIQENRSKGNKIEYHAIELQDYLNPFSNLGIEEQQYIFSLRCEVNPLRENFKRNTNIEKIHCVKNCQAELDNTHLVFCPKLNENPEINFSKILKGTLPQKIEALRQATDNERIRNLDRKNPVIQ